MQCEQSIWEGQELWAVLLLHTTYAVVATLTLSAGWV